MFHFRLFLLTDDYTLVMLAHQYWPTWVLQLQGSVGLSHSSYFENLFPSIVSIRAYGAQEAFKKESLKRIDHFTNLSRVSYNLNRWISIRIDLLGASFTATLASYLLVTRKINAANTGFSLNMSLEFCALILWLVRWYNEFEVKANRYDTVGRQQLVEADCSKVWNVFNRI